MRVRMATLHSPLLLPREKAEPDRQTDKKGQGEITGNKRRGERDKKNSKRRVGIRGLERQKVGEVDEEREDS